MTGMAVDSALDTPAPEDLWRDAGVLAHPVGGGRDAVWVLRRDHAEAVRGLGVERLRRVVHEPDGELAARRAIQARVFSEMLPKARHQCRPRRGREQARMEGIVARTAFLLVGGVRGERAQAVGRRKPR